MKTVLPAVLLLPLLLPAPAAPAADAPRLSDEAVRRVFPALVRIYVVTEDSENGRLVRTRASGSGVIISPDGYLVTNHHVAGRATRMVVNLADQQEIEADLVGTDPMTDIAVLKLRLDQRRDPSAPVPVAVWGDSDRLQVGDAVFALGSPGALSQSVTQGIVSNTRMTMPKGMAGALRMEGEDVGSLVRWIAHDAVIFGGNSGGPLSNQAGEVIGINEIGVASLGGAIPGNLARAVAEEIIRNGFVSRSWVGWMIQPRLKGGGKDAAGVLIGGVLEDSPAHRAGLRAGDRVTRYRQTAVDASIPEDLPVINQLVASTPPGSEVEVELIRDGKPIAVKLTTEQREKMQPLPVELKEWGMTARNLSKLSAIALNRSNTSGVLVDSLRQGFGGAASKPPLAAMDILTAVEGIPVADTAALETATGTLLKDVEERRKVLVTFERGREQLMTVVEIGKETDPDRPDRPRKPWAAMRTQVLTRELADALRLEARRGVRITALFPGKAAERAGFRVGDVLTHLDGELIEASRPEDAEMFRTMIRRRRVGDEASFTLVRDGKEMKLAMVLEPPPGEEENLAQYKDADFEFEVRELSYQDRLDRFLADDAPGLLVSSVAPGGWASLGGLAAQDILLAVQGRPVSTPDALEETFAALAAEKPRHVSLFVRRGVSTLFLEIEPNWSRPAPKP